MRVGAQETTWGAALKGEHPTGLPEHHQCQASPASSSGLGGGLCRTSHLLPRGAQSRAEGVCGGGAKLSASYTSLSYRLEAAKLSKLRDKKLRWHPNPGWQDSEQGLLCPTAPPVDTFPPPDATQSLASWSWVAEPDVEARRQ